MSRSEENAGFICIRCGRRVRPLSNGSYRNHCPFCLYSRHVDIGPGDRRCDCRGLMEPIGLHYRSGKGFQLVHRCLRCGHKSVNRIAENTEQPDDSERLSRL